MRLWIGVHLPQLALELFRPRWTEPGAYGVIDGEQVLLASKLAAQSGIKIGMRRASAQAISPHATWFERDMNKESEALNSVAQTLLRYTPELSLAIENSILLDVTASLRVFGGRLKLCRRIKESIARLGFTEHLSCAPTAQGAWLLAHAHSRIRRTLKMSSLSKRLDALPASLLLAARPHHEWLHGIGCRSLGDMRKLPRAALQRRTNTDLLMELDQAYGLAIELFEWVNAPDSFDVRLELPDYIERTENLLAGAQRLIAQMMGWLTSRKKALTHAVLWLEHEKARTASTMLSTAIDIKLAEPSWHEEYLLRLLNEQLGRIQLSTSVIALRLEAKEVCAMRPPNVSLFPEPGGTSADFNRLIELLKARLGEEGVLIAAPYADHRPEVSNRWVAIRPNASTTMVSTPSLRPSFLLARPIALLTREHCPFYGSPLTLIQGPERIETGWWDKRYPVVVRDYFIAQSGDAVCYWIYRERVHEEVQWFLHGLFA
jgi:protein ImuB